MLGQITGRNESIISENDIEAGMFEAIFQKFWISLLGLPAKSPLSQHPITLPSIQCWWQASIPLTFQAFLASSSLLELGRHGKGVIQQLILLQRITYYLYCR